MDRPKVGISLVILHKGKILIGTRMGSHGEGTFALPGGHLEGGEEWGVCAARELEEETNLRIPPDHFSYLTTTNNIFEEEQKHYVDVCMIALCPEDQEAINAEPNKCLQWDYYTLEEACGLRPLFLPLRQILDSSSLEEAIILMMEE